MQQRVLSLPLYQRLHNSYHYQTTICFEMAKRLHKVLSLGHSLRTCVVIVLTCLMVYFKSKDINSITGKCKFASTRRKCTLTNKRRNSVNFSIYLKQKNNQEI